MDLCYFPLARFLVGLVLPAWALANLFTLGVSVVNGQEAKPNVLRIGTSGTLTAQKADTKREQAALSTLKRFIEDETGLNNEIVQQESWRALVDAMEQGRLQLGVFQGYEFAWIQAKHPRIKPLALAINGSRYPVACVVVKRTNPAQDFAGLEGQSLDIPNTGPAFQRLFVHRQSQNCGKTLETFFSRVASQENVEDALDDVVDGAIQAVVVEQSALEAYKRRKPGRFHRLKEISRSQPFPPVVIAYCEKSINLTSLLRFQLGFREASKKVSGETVLMLFRLTAFETVPADFAKVLAETRKTYPSPNAANSEMIDFPPDRYITYHSDVIPRPFRAAPGHSAVASDHAGLHISGHHSRRNVDRIFLAWRLP
jgi:ABC-type phosphate/phosphonate transport system substrate-binding protein